MSTVGKKTSITTDINTEREGETFLPKDSNGKELNLIDYEDRYNVLIMELKKLIRILKLKSISSQLICILKMLMMDIWLQQILRQQ